MTISNEQRWQFCRNFGSHVFDLAMRDAALRERIHRWYQGWETKAEDIDTKAQALICLGLHSISFDRPIAATSDLRAIRATAVAEAVHTRPHHELFASLPELSADGMADVQALRLMSYQFGTHVGVSPVAKQWAWMTTSALTWLGHANTSASASGRATCGEIMDLGP
ncbi:hypothetical protein [Streptomyces caatingaensis]|uniref:Uncharacterized protein n=1 Tax=Streptomyces caatingaensis TaxID=1678637 RepID=A0A0K9X9H7_9ACTN|nr:hypothetical protein [Streptomyces caatingaensis]KNB50074.1 hypothetical protein AC230_25545 [Streptomyces caatingaensis]